jgi:hypothetical protein
MESTNFNDFDLSDCSINQQIFKEMETGLYTNKVIVEDVNQKIIIDDTQDKFSPIDKQEDKINDNEDDLDYVIIKKNNIIRKPICPGIEKILKMDTHDVLELYSFSCIAWLKDVIEQGKYANNFKLNREL